MSRKAVLLALSFVFATLFYAQGLAQPPAPETAARRTAPVLSMANWDPFNRSQIEKLIQTHGKDGGHYDPAKPPYAVLDWDNTMVFLDVEEAVLIYQLENLHFAMSPRQLDKALRMGIPSTPFTGRHNNAAGQPVSIDRIVPDIVESYTWLYHHYRGLKGALPLPEVRRHPHYENFITKVRYLYEAIGDSFDVSVSYPWVLYLLTGMDRQQVQALTRATIDWQLTQPVGAVIWTSPASMPGRSGVVSVRWQNGLRLIPEMQELVQTLKEAGFDIWICTASFTDVIQEIASNPAFGFGIPANRVIGMELERHPSGRLRTEYRRGHEQTYGKGKTKALLRRVVPKYGYGPVFVAGDSEGDASMMQDFADTKLVLIVNRLKGGNIGKLSRLAAASYGKPDARYLLQGRDDNTGQFLPSPHHVRQGASTGSILP